MKDIDLQTGIIETFSKDKMTGEIHIKKEQDVTGFLQANQDERNNSTAGFKGDMHKMASIPPIVIEMWVEEMKRLGYRKPNPLIKENIKFLKAKLNSPEWNLLRTKQGVI